MQHAPRVDDVPLAERGEVVAVERAALLHRPRDTSGRVAAAERLRAGDAVAVVVERMDARGAEPARGERGQAAARPDVEEALPLDLIARQHRLERAHGRVDALFGQDSEEIAPVPAEGEPRVALVWGCERRFSGTRHVRRSPSGHSACRNERVVQSQSPPLWTSVMDRYSRATLQPRAGRTARAIPQQHADPNPAGATFVQQKGAARSPYTPLRLPILSRPMLSRYFHPTILPSC